MRHLLASILALGLLFGALNILWNSDPFVNNAILVRKNLPEPMREAIRKALLDTKSQPEHEAICESLDISGFYPASAGDYAKADEFISRFEREVRKVRQP